MNKSIICYLYHIFKHLTFYKFLYILTEEDKMLTQEEDKMLTPEEYSIIVSIDVLKIHKLGDKSVRLPEWLQEQHEEPVLTKKSGRPKNTENKTPFRKKSLAKSFHANIKPRVGGKFVSINYLKKKLIYPEILISELSSKNACLKPIFLTDSLEQRKQKENFNSKSS